MIVSASFLDRNFRTGLRFLRAKLIDETILETCLQKFKSESIWKPSNLTELEMGILLPRLHLKLSN